jgi:hypothetical protein
MKAGVVAIPIFVVGIIGCLFWSNADAAAAENSAANGTSKSKIIRKDAESSTVGSEWEGFYEAASKSCSTPPGGGIPCSRFKDCLRIRKSSDYYTVEIHSVQAYQNTCSAVLEMRDDTKGLVYMDSKRREVRLLREGSNLTLTTNGFNPVGYCGAHASLDGIAFPVAGKQAIDRTCAEEWLRESALAKRNSW